MRKFVIIILTVLLVITSVGFGLYTWYNNIIFAENLSSEQVTFTVSKGDNLISIIPSLSDKGLIGNADAVKAYIKFNNISANIKAGNYLINKGTNVPNLIKILEEGTFKASISITIPEGMRYEQIALLLSEKFESAAENVNFNKDEFLNICADPDKYSFEEDVQLILSKYKPVGKPLRGLLFPDTYSFDYDSSAQKVIESMVKNLDKRLIDNGITNDNLFKNQNNLQSVYEVISLASIIEKEAGNDADRPIVSGIFHNRLAVNYPLESDITIHFIKNDEDTFISFADTKIDSPYNTYLHAGVTPTPINNPGISSILAALNPNKNDYFYFIYDASGKLYYARTYQEHLNNVNRYL